MNEILINPHEIESVWEKNKVCFVKTKTGKVWVCEPQTLQCEFMTIEARRNHDYSPTTIPTMEYIKLKCESGKGSLIRLKLVQKGKSESNG